jgi:hypothetical protein
MRATAYTLRMLGALEYLPNALEVALDRRNRKRAILIARQIVAIRRAGLYPNEWPRA